MTGSQIAACSGSESRFAGMLLLGVDLKYCCICKGQPCYVFVVVPVNVSGLTELS